MSAAKAAAFDFGGAPRSLGATPALSNKSKLPKRVKPASGTLTPSGTGPCSSSTAPPSAAPPSPGGACPASGGARARLSSPHPGGWPAGGPAPGPPPRPPAAPGRPLPRQRRGQHALFFHQPGALPGGRAEAVGDLVLTRVSRQPLGLAVRGAGDEQALTRAQPLARRLRESAHVAAEARRGLRGQGVVLGPGGFERQLFERQARRSRRARLEGRPAQEKLSRSRRHAPLGARRGVVFLPALPELAGLLDRKSTRLNSSHS